MSVTGNYTGFAVAVVGTNGTGKTFYMDKMIQGYERPVLALIDDDGERYFHNWQEIQKEDIKKVWKGRFKIYVNGSKKEKDEIFKEINENFAQNPKTGGCIFIDDAMTILDKRPEAAAQIFKRRRNKRNDIILNVHGFSEFPVMLVKNLTNIIVCRSMDSTKALEARINAEQARQLKACISIVNRACKRNPYFKLDFNVLEPMDFVSMLEDANFMREIDNIPIVKKK